MKKKILTAVITVFFTVFAGALSGAKLVDRILIKVNDALILESEVDESVSLIAEQAELAGKKIDKKEVRKKVIDNLIEQKLIISVAGKEQVGVSNEAVAERVNNFIEKLRQKFPNEREFEAKLMEEGITYADFRAKIRSQVKTSLIFKKVKQKKQSEFISRAGVTDGEIKKYYKNNKGEFKVGDEVKISQIYFEKASVDDAEKKAEQAVNFIENGGSFDKVSNNLVGKDGISGGDLGWVDTSQMNREVRRALSNPRRGQTVGPVETADGFHVFRVKDYRKGKTKELKEVKEKVRVAVIEKKVEKMWDEWIRETKEKAFIKRMKG